MTDTDKKSMVALTTYPGMSGKDVSEITGISQSSLLRSRRRLLDAGVLKPVKIPNFGRIGYDVIFSSFGVVKEKRGDGIVPRIPGIFQLVLERSKGFGTGVARDYVDFYRLLIQFRERYPWIDEERFGFHVFPIGLTDFWRFEEYGPLLSDNFSVSIDTEGTPGTPMKGPVYRFGKGEWEVYKALIEKPSMSVESMASLLGTSRQRVYRLDRVFREEKLYTDRMIPNLKMLGYEMLMFASWNMASGEHEQLDKFMRKGGMPAAFFMMGSPIEGVMVSAFKSFRESSRISDSVAKMRRSIGADKQELDLVFLSMPDTSMTVDFTSVFNMGNELIL